MPDPDPVPNATTSELRDDFEDGTIGSPWNVDSTPPSIVENGGQLVMTLAYDVTATKLISSARYDFVDSAIDIHLPNGFPIGGRARFVVVSSAGTSTGMTFENEMVGLLLEDQQNIFFASDPPLPTYWRMRQYEGNVAVDSSLDGVSWTPRSDTPTAFDLTNRHIVLGVDRNPGEIGEIQFRVSRVGTVPALVAP